VVDCDPIFINDGPVWTSAGVTAGMDPALALVDDDLGRDVALPVARELVLFLRRPGSQSQFSVPLWSPQPSTDPIRTVVSAVHLAPGDRHTIDDLARRAQMSPRQLQRRFSEEIGIPPGSYVERVRVEAARRRNCGRATRPRRGRLPREVKAGPSVPRPLGTVVDAEVGGRQDVRPALSRRRLPARRGGCARR
jgi:AraC-like DNA-binding protein